MLGGLASIGLGLAALTRLLACLEWHLLNRVVLPAGLDYDSGTCLRVRDGIVMAKRNAQA
jgi:hypothetical protein